MRKQLLFCKGLSRLLHTAGRGQKFFIHSSKKIIQNRLSKSDKSAVGLVNMVAECQKSIEINYESSGEFNLKALHNNDSIQMNVDGDTDGIYNRLTPSTKIDHPPFV